MNDFSKTMLILMGTIITTKAAVLAVLLAKNLLGKTEKKLEEKKEVK